jgi:hypothetical protein
VAQHVSDMTRLPCSLDGFARAPIHVRMNTQYALMTP